jgi:polyisoprenoid-binding protein YceI
MTHTNRVFSSALTAFFLATVACDKNPTQDKPKAEIVDSPATTKPTATTTATAAVAATATATAAGTATAATTGTAAAAAGGEIELNATNCKIAFTGSKTGGAHSGVFGKVRGSVKRAAKLEESTITVEVDVASLRTDSGKLDEHLRSDDFFDVAKFPKASFKSTEIVAEAGKNTTHKVTGVMEIKGIKKTLKFPAKIEAKDDGSLAVRADFVIGRKGFRVDSAGLTDYLIKDEVLMGITITGK